MVSEGGYTLALRTPSRRPGRTGQVSFVIEGPDGARHGVRRGAREAAALHRRTPRLHRLPARPPALADDGTWTTRLDLTPGQWRVFADFKPTGGEALTLGADLAVPGDYGPSRWARPARTATVDGYTVTLEGDLAPATHSSSAERDAATASRSPTCSPTSAPTATWSRCATATSPTCTSTPTASPATGRPSRAGGRVRRRGAQRRRPTGSTSTSSTTAWCARPSSSSTRQRPAADDDACDAPTPAPSWRSPA